MLMQTPANGSPERVRTSRISPTFAASGFVREKRRVRAPVGSRAVVWEAVRSEMGSGHFLIGEGGGAWTFMDLVCVSEPGE